MKSALRIIFQVKSSSYKYEKNNNITNNDLVIDAFINIFSTKISIPYRLGK